MGPGRGWIAVAAVVLLGLLTGTSSTLSAWTTGRITNSADNAAVATLSVTHTYASGSCASAPRTTTAACAAGLTPTAGAPASSTDAITNNSAVAITQTLTAASCAPVRFSNNQQAADPMLPRNTVTFQQPDPWGTSSAASFTGSGYAADIVGTSGSGLLGLLSNSYSAGVWFNAADAQGGGLISLDVSRANTKSATGNPMVWLDTAGKVNFSANGLLGLNITGASAGSYASGWHLVVITVNTVDNGILGLSKTVRLYVDGAQVASGTALTLLTTTSGIWHVGWADFTGLTPPTSATFHGRLSGAFVNQATALSAAQVTALSTAASATAFRTTLAGQSGIASIWMLDDDGITTYGGALPAPMTDPCSQVDVTLAFTTPTATVASTSLTNLVAPANNPRALAAPAPGQTQGLTIGTTRGASYSTDITGLRLLVPMTFSYGTAPASGWTTSLQWGGDPRQVFVA